MEVESLVERQLVHAQRTLGVRVINDGPNRSYVYVPFCGSEREWQFLWSPSNANNNHSEVTAPEVVMDRGAEALVPLATLPALLRWPSDTAGLTTALRQLRRQYSIARAEQLRRITAHSSQRHQLEVATLSAIPGAQGCVTSHSFQWLVPVGSHQPDERWEPPVGLWLWLRFPEGTPECRLLGEGEGAPERRLLGEGAEEVELPEWTSEDCTVTFLPRVEDAVAMAVERRAQREIFVTGVTGVAGEWGAPLEWQGAVGMWAVGPLPCVAAVEWPVTFPAEPPQVTLTACGVTLGGRVPSVSLRQLPWSPRWTGAEWARRTLPLLASRMVWYSVTHWQADLRGLCEDWA